MWLLFERKKKLNILFFSANVRHLLHSKNNADDDNIICIWYVHAFHVSIMPSCVKKIYTILIPTFHINGEKNKRSPGKKNKQTHTFCLLIRLRLYYRIDFHLFVVVVVIDIGIVAAVVAVSLIIWDILLSHWSIRGLYFGLTYTLLWDLMNLIDGRHLNTSIEMIW